MVDIFSPFRLSKYQVNSRGGEIYVDRKIRAWLDGFKSEGNEKHSETEWKIYRQITREGFDEDESIQEPGVFPIISLVVVLYNSEEWVKNLNDLFTNLDPWLFEVIVIDNGSNDSAAEDIISVGTKVRKIRLETSLPFSAAVNEGVRAAAGELLLLINPDVWIPRSSLWELIHFYAKHSDAAAIAPKLMLMRTPGFINSVGNHVPLFRWGYDLGLGHLDLGQFDHIQEIEAACFASVLIPREKWAAVGKLDEGYPMYYEDSDWCYRARAMGYEILLAPKAKVYHDFGGNNGSERISSRKLENVTYGRLRFVIKNFPTYKRSIFLVSYWIFDVALSIFLTFRKINFAYKNQLMLAWKDYRDISRDTKNNHRDEIMEDILKKKTISPQIKKGYPIIKKNFNYFRNLRF